MANRRRNVTDRTEESWRPPLLATPDNRWRPVLAAVRRWLDLQAGSIWRDLAPELAQTSGNVVDVGCGAQPYRGLFPAEVKYQAIDTADAKEHFGYEVPDTRYYRGDVWPVDDHSVDLVLMTETLEHILDPGQFLAEAHRCLRPGGRLVATVPFAARWHFIPHDYWRFTPSGLKCLLERAHFENIAVYARGNAVTVACYKIMALVLPLLLPQDGGWPQRMMRRILGLIGSPVLLVGALVGNLSLRGPGGDDCLGFTVLARKPSTHR